MRPPNLDIYVEDKTLGHGRRVQNVKPGDPYETVEARVREAIGNHFKYKLARPEVLNRIGDNIGAFNFNTPEFAGPIFDGMLKNPFGRNRKKIDEAPPELARSGTRRRAHPSCGRQIAHPRAPPRAGNFRGTERKSKTVGSGIGSGGGGGTEGTANDDYRTG